jgi:hypothetical protein
MMRFAKYFAWLLLVVGVLQIYSTLAQPGPRYIERAIYCDYFAGSWHCQDDFPQTLAVDTATWARYMLPFDVVLMLTAGTILYGTSKASKRTVGAAFAALVVLFAVQKNYTPRVYASRESEKIVPEVQSPSLPRNVQAAPVAGPEPSVEVAASVSQRPLENGELVGRSDRLKLTKNGLVLQSISGENDDGEIVPVPDKVMTLQRWLATESSRVVYFFSSPQIKGQAYEDLSPVQKGLVQDFCRQGLQIYQVTGSDDHPASVCEK